MVTTIADINRYNSIKKDLIGSISTQIDMLFDSAIAAEIIESNSGGLNIRFTEDFMDSIIQTTITIPYDLIDGKVFLNTQNNQ